MDAGAIRWVNPGTLLLFFGPTAFLFVIHYCAVPIESEAADRRQFPPALARSMALTALLDIVVGCVGRQGGLVKPCVFTVMGHTH